MIIKKFPLTSEQLELLLAFENSDNLQELSDLLCKDKSVISRQLKKLNACYPVLIKEKKKWIISNIGIEINKITRETIQKLNSKININNTLNKSNIAFIVINAQKALLETNIGRSNKLAEKNISLALKYLRKESVNIFHVKHISDSSKSSFFRESELSQFITELAPTNEEIVIIKKKSSSFSETNLLKVLKEKKISNLFIAGFTANECIEATARDANDLGFNSYVISDATAMFDFIGHDKNIYKAEEVQKIILANINQLYAKVIKTSEMLDILDLLQ